MSDPFSIPSFIDSIAEQFKIKKSDIWKLQFNQLELWTNEHGFSVILERDKEDIIDWKTDSITINSKPHWENRYYALLHECGHLLANHDESFLDYNYPCYVRHEDKRKMKTDAYRVSVVGEEIEAWKLGRNLGDKILNHFIDHNKYDKMMTECVMSYLFWATEEEENDLNSTGH